MIFEVSTMIRQPIEKVFEYVTNVEHHAQWQTATLEDKILSEGPLGMGTTIHHVGKFLGRRIENTSEVTEYEPNTNFAYKTVSGSLPVEMRYRFESVEGGTRLTLTAGGETGRFFKLAEPIVARSAKRLLDEDLIRLKNILEAPT